MERRITKLKQGTEVRYFDHKCYVDEVYSHIAYLHDTTTAEMFCVCLGDLVMAGLEPFSPPSTGFVVNVAPA